LVLQQDEDQLILPQGWSVTLASTLPCFTFNVQRLAMIALLPALAFWILDAPTYRKKVIPQTYVLSAPSGRHGHNYHGPSLTKDKGEKLKRRLLNS